MAEERQQEEEAAAAVASTSAVPQRGVKRRRRPAAAAGSKNSKDSPGDAASSSKAAAPSYAPSYAAVKKYTHGKPSKKPVTTVSLPRGFGKVRTFGMIETQTHRRTRSSHPT